MDSSNPFRILCIVHRLTSKHSEIFVLYFPSWMSEVQHTVSKCLLSSQCRTDFSLLYSRQTACTKLFIQNSDILHIAHFISKFILLWQPNSRIYQLHLWYSHFLLTSKQPWGKSNQLDGYFLIWNSPNLSKFRYSIILILSFWD